MDILICNSVLLRDFVNQSKGIIFVESNTKSIQKERK
jgi:hypothetical protein